MIRIGVIGIGRMGGKHALNVARGRAKGGVLTAVCDIDKEKTDQFISKFNKVKAYNDYKQMLSDDIVDAVIIATEHYYHVPIAIDCLKAGKHILVEKPVAVTVGEAETLSKFAEDYPDKVFALMYNQRTNRMYRYAKQIIEGNGLGEIRRINFIISDWYRSQAYYDQGGWRASWSGEGGGALINQCIHQLDILQWLAGMPISITAKCNTRNREITVENEVIATFEYPNNVYASFTAATNELNGSNRLEIAGTHGRILIDKYRMKYIRHNKSEIEVNNTTTKGYGYSFYKVKRLNYGIFNAIYDLTIGQQFNIIKNFVKAIEGKAQLIADGREGIKALSIINAIYLSAHLNKTVKLPLDSVKYDNFIKEKVDEELKIKEIKQ